MNSTQSLTVPLGQDAHQLAERFAAEQATPEKGKQVYLNTLSVYAVRSYLEWLSVPTHLTQSDCWHPGARALFNLGDLVIPNVGKLECRALLPGETTMVVPLESVRDRIGYVVVQFSQTLDSAELLGFATAPNESLEVPVARLRSLDALIDTIHQKQPLTHLQNWFEGLFNEVWQPPEFLLAENFQRLEFARRSSRPAFRSIGARASAVSRAKLITIDLETGIAVVLVAQLVPTETTDVSISLRVYPACTTSYLPEGLQLKVIDETGVPCLGTQARSMDDWIQLDFQGHPGEPFEVQLELNENGTTEKFVI